MKYKPTSDRLIIKPIKEEYKGSIIIAETDECKPVTGRVMRVGNYVSNEIKEGDEVVFNEYAGTDIEYMDETYLILNECEVLGVIK